MGFALKDIPGERGIMVPVSGLQMNASFDRAHVRMLAESIRVGGQQESVIVSSRRAPNGDNIANGLHRVKAVKLLGIDEIRADVLDFEYPDFLAAQIIGAQPHTAIHVSRIPPLLRTLFAETPWASKIAPAEAFEVPTKMKYRKPSKSLVARGLSRDDQEAVAEWAKTQATALKLELGRVVNILKLADNVDPSLLDLIGTNQQGRVPLAESVLTQLGEHVPDRRWQIEVVSAITEQKLGEHDSKKLIAAFGETQTPSEMRAVLKKQWRTRMELRVRPEPVIIDQAAIDRETCAREQFQITDAIRRINEAASALGAIPINNQPHMRDRVKEALIRFEIARARYEGNEGRADLLAELVTQSVQLKSRNAQLERRIERLETALSASERSDTVNRLNAITKLGRPD